MSIFLCSSLSKGGEQLGFEPDLTLRQKAVYHAYNPGNIPGFPGPQLAEPLKR